MATPPSEANDSRWSRMPARRPAASRPAAGATRASSANVCDQNPKKSAGRLSGARKAVTEAAYPAPHQAGAVPEAGPKVTYSAGRTSLGGLVPGVQADGRELNA